MDDSVTATPYVQQARSTTAPSVRGTSQYPFVDYYRTYNETDLLNELIRLTSLPKVKQNVSLLQRIGSVVELYNERTNTGEVHTMFTRVVAGFGNVDQLLSVARREENVKVSFVICGMAAMAFIAYKLIQIYA